MNVQRHESALEGFAPPRVPLGRIELLFIWCFWGCIAALMFINALINPVTEFSVRLPPMAPLLAALLECLIWALVTPLIFRLTGHYSFERPQQVLHVVLLVALGLVFAMGMSKLAAYVRYQEAVYYSLTDAAFRHLAATDLTAIARKFWFMNEFVIYLVILVAGFARDYFIRYQARHAQASALQAQTAHLHAELANSRLSALRTQLNPHFLFNTLNAVSSLVERDPRGARRMIARLSNLLRDTLEGKDLEVPLERELVFVRRYIDIMQTRFQGRLETTENIAPDTLDAMVPNLILQPLVENAIKYGIEKLDGVGRISIQARRSGESLMLSVVDNGTTEPNTRLQEDQGGSGLGLRNTKARLAQSYGDQQSLTLRSNPTGGVVAQVVMPFHKAKMIA